MALVACRECGKEISSEAPQCPHCGVPSKAAAKAQKSAYQATELVGAMVTIVFSVAGLWLLWPIIKYTEVGVWISTLLAFAKT